MRRCDNSVVMAQPCEVYAMQLQKPDVTRAGSQKSCNKKDCCSIMESINGGICKVQACMLENGRVDGDVNLVVFVMAPCKIISVAKLFFANLLLFYLFVTHVFWTLFHITCIICFFRRLL